MNDNQKAVVHLAAIPFQAAVHSRVDSALKQNGVGTVGRSIAQLILLGIGIWAHGAIENS